jgi:DNA-binding GntR family transcriptional regulator
MTTQSGSAAIRADEVRDALRSAILVAEFAPGAVVTESAVALRHGVARPTAKLAIESLVAEGMLVRQAQRAARVPVLAAADVRDIYATRGILEAAAAEALAESGAVPPEAVAAQRRLAAEATGPAILDDIAFHRALAAGQSNARLARMHGLLMGEVELCIGQVQAHGLLARDVVVAQHQRILDAIVAGDPAAASRATREHLAASRDALLAHHPAPAGA